MSPQRPVGPFPRPPFFGTIEHVFDASSPEAPQPPRPAWESLPPGVELAEALTRLEPADASGHDLVEAIRAWERLASWAAARQLACIAELAYRRPVVGPEADQTPPPVQRAPQVSEFAADEIAAALRTSRRAADQRLDLALTLADRLPAAQAALAAGRIDLARARALADVTTPLSDHQAAAVALVAVGPAEEQTPAQLRAAASRIALAVDPAAAAARHSTEVAGRRVERWPLPDGMAELRAILRADAAETVWAALTARARQAVGEGDERSLDARRADVLVDLATAALDDPSLPREHRARPHIRVTVPATTLLGLDDAPAELAGYGPLPAAVAREIAAEGTWQRLLTDPATGALREVGRHTYTPPAAMAEHVLARDRTCRFPGCRQPAERCDLDHTRPHPQGPTCACNLGPCCRRHHRLKHRTRWRLEQPQPGHFDWTSPTGHTYRVRPEPLAPVPRGTPRPAAPEDAPGEPPCRHDEDPPPF